MFFEYLIASLINVVVFVAIIAGMGILMVIANMSKIFVRKDKENKHG